MATWKKIIVSGSNAHLTGITSSVLTANNILQAGTGGAIQNSGITLSGNTLALGGNSITSTGTNSVLTGSFAGTFSGSLTVNLQNLTNGTGISAFTYNGNSTATVAISGASSLSNDTIPIWNGNSFENSSISENPGNGNVIISGNELIVSSPILATGQISSSAGLFGTTLTATGNSTIGGTLIVTNRLTANGAITTTNITASGNISSSAGLIGATLTTSGNGTIGGNLSVIGAAAIGGPLTASGNVIIGVPENPVNITLANPLNSTTNVNSILVVTSSNRIATQSIDNRVWGTTLVDNNGTSFTANRVPYATDGNSLIDSVEFTFDSGNKLITVGGSKYGTNSQIVGTLDVTGTTTLTGALTVNNSISASGNISGSTLRIVGNESIGGTSTITGRLTANGAITTTNITASGNISSSAGLIGATLTTSGNGTIGGNLSVTGTTTLTGALTVNNSISASGNISGSTLRIVGNESIGGNSAIGGTLDVTGTTTLAGNLLANGNTTLGNQTTDTLIISGSSISVPSIGAGSTDTVIIRTATNTLATRTIDSRVWGSTLVDASGTPVANQVPYWTDANTLAGEAGFTYNPSTDVFTAPNVVVTSNLTVQGTASFQNTTNLEVADRFILLASGSNTAGEGGIVVQQATQNVGEIFGWDNDALRWAVTSSFSANQSSFTPDAFMAAVTTAAGTTPSVAARYSAVGNIYVSSGDESIWIYS